MSLILFSASWCGPCQTLKGQMTPDMKSKVQMVDPQANESLAKQYGVRTIPTLVNTEDGSTVRGPHHILSFLKNM